MVEKMESAPLPTRLPSFDANVGLMVKDLDLERPDSWVRDVVKELVSLACPGCAHATVDHSWTKDPAPCLKVGCPCVSDMDGIAMETSNVERTAAYAALDAHMRSLITAALAARGWTRQPFALVGGQ